MADLTDEAKNAIHSAYAEADEMERSNEYEKTQSDTSQLAAILICLTEAICLELAALRESIDQHTE